MFAVCVLTSQCIKECTYLLTLRLWQMLLQNFATGGLSRSCISISFKISWFICVRLWQMLLRISPAAGIHHSCISISFTISFVVCVQTVTNAVKKFFYRAFDNPIFQFREFLAPLQKCIPTCATARDCTICIYECPRGCQNVLTSLRVKRFPNYKFWIRSCPRGERIF